MNSAKKIRNSSFEVKLILGSTPEKCVLYKLALTPTRCKIFFCFFQFLQNILFKAQLPIIFLLYRTLKIGSEIILRFREIVFKEIKFLI